MFNEDKWSGYEQDKWSGKKREAKWIPSHTERYLVSDISDVVNEEFTNIYFEYNDKTGKIISINNEGQVNQREVIIKVRDLNNWVRLYIITPDKDGEDYSSIDHKMTVSTFSLIKEKGKWKLGDDISITVHDNPI